VIATSTKVPVTGVNVTAIDDAYFAREKVAKKTGEAALFDSSATPASRLSDAHKSTQAAIDKALNANIAKVEFLKSYLQAKFSLNKGDKPHALQF
jgi:large subunit ribosomal protein L6e